MIYEPITTRSQTLHLTSKAALYFIDLGYWACGGDITENTFNYPKHGGYYDNNLDCRWTIHRNYTFFLRFTRFDVDNDETAGGCYFDYLRIGDGKKLWSSTLLQGDVFVSSGTIQVIFQTDWYRTSTGFKLEIIEGKKGIFKMWSTQCLARRQIDGILGYKVNIATVSYTHLTLPTKA